MRKNGVSRRELKLRRRGRVGIVNRWVEGAIEWTMHEMFFGLAVNMYTGKPN